MRPGPCDVTPSPLQPDPTGRVPLPPRAACIRTEAFRCGTRRWMHVNVHTNSSNIGPCIGGLPSCPLERRKWNATVPVLPARELFADDDAVPFFPSLALFPALYRFSFSVFAAVHRPCFWRHAAFRFNSV